jgi:hypothetical protein
MKKTLALSLVALVMLVSLCAAPAIAATVDPVAAITDGYYTYAFNAAGYGMFTGFFRFYPEKPALGAVFYCGLINNGVTFAGTYTVDKTDKAYSCYMTREENIDGKLTDGVAPYTVTFFDFAGNEIGACGFDGDVLYNDIPTFVSPASGNNAFIHDTDASSEYADTYAGELGVKYLDFVDAEDDTATLTLYHNGRYADLVLIIVEGDWAISGGDAVSGFTYALMPDEAYDTPVTLTVSSDQSSAAYTPDGGDELSMINTALTGAKPVFTFIGTQTIEAYGADANLALSLYDDGTAALEIDLFGAKAIADQGAYEMVNDFTFGVTFDNAGRVESSIDFDTMIITIQYVGAIEGLGDIDSTLTLQQ